MDTRQSYGEAIIGVVKYQSKLKTALSTNFYGGKKGMKTRILSIMDSGKKKTGMVVICGILILTMGTGFAFAASTGSNVGVSPTAATPTAATPTARASNNSSDNDKSWLENSKWREAFAEAERSNPSANDAERAWREKLWREAYAESERFWAQLEKESRESWAEFFSAYEQYGLTYSKEINRLYYNGELVRYFENNTATEKGTFSGTVHPGAADGKIDVHAVHDSAGKTVGVEPYSQADFDARTLTMYTNASSTTSVSGGTDNAQPGAYETGITETGR
jgi:hypothetical protein